MDGTNKHLAARYDAAAKGWQSKIAPLGYPEAYVELVQHPGRLDAFGAFKTSAGFARAGAALGPFMLAPPRSRAFEAALA